MKKIKVQVPEELQEIAPNYLKNRILDLAVLKDALNRKDFKAISAIAHKTKGTAGGYGFDELGAIAKSLEMAAKSEVLRDADAAWEKMKIHLESVEIV